MCFLCDFLFCQIHQLIHPKFAFHDHLSDTIRLSSTAFAALRELFSAKIGNYLPSDVSGELIKSKRLCQVEEEIKLEVQTRLENGQSVADLEEEVVKTPSSLMGLNDAADEFFDVSEPLDYDQTENDWSSDFGLETYSQVLPV